MAYNTRSAEAYIVFAGTAYSTYNGFELYLYILYLFEKRNKSAAISLVYQTTNFYSKDEWDILSQIPG